MGCHIPGGVKRSLALVAVLAGCASGHADRPDAPGTPGPAADAAPVEFPDAMAMIDARPPIDAPPPVDAPTPVDTAPPVDAPTPADAPRPVDAPPPVDAAPAADAPPDACVPVTTELLANPVFDLTPAGTGWNATPIDPMYPIITSPSGFSAQSAPYVAWLGGISGSDEGVTSNLTDVLYQDVTVPPGTTQLVLTGYYVVGTNETTTTAVYDTASVDLIQTNGTPIENVLSLSNLTTTSNWTAFSHAFTASVAGQTVRVRLTSTNDASNSTGFVFDTFSLEATHCP